MMSHRVSFSMVVLLVMVGSVLGGCASGDIDEDELGQQAVHETDDQIDDQPDNHQQDDAPTLTRGSRVSLSAGGGTGQSENYRSRVSVGTPLPAAGGETENYRVRMGIAPILIDSREGQ